MGKINTADNLNQGLPENTGLDDTAKEALRRQLEKDGDGGIAVGSFADLQRGTVGNPIEGPFNDNVENPEKLTTIPEIAENAADAQAPGKSGSSDKRSKK